MSCQYHKADSIKMFPDQRSVTAQLKDLIVLANHNGLYDAADWLQERLTENKSVEKIDSHA